MSATTVVHIRDMKPGDVYVGRAGHGQDGYFGNPFKIQAGEPKGSTLKRYKRWFLQRLSTDPFFKKRILALKGKRLVCFCAPRPCHANIIANWLNAQAA